MKVDIYDYSADEVRTYNAPRIEDAVSRYLDDMEAEGVTLCDHIDVVLRVDDEDDGAWRRYSVSHEMVREVSVDRGRRVPDPTKRGER